MNAQKLKNNKIALSSKAPRKDAIEVIEDLKVAEFFKLMKSARNWSENLDDKRDIIFTTYETKESKVCKEFDKILQRRRYFEERNIFDDSKIIKKEEAQVKMIEEVSPEQHTNGKNKQKIISYNSEIKGTSRLLHIPKKQIIKIVRRKGLIDDNNRPNSVCIDNKMREEFFHDVKSTVRFFDTGLYEIMNTEEDKHFYNKWDTIIAQVYEEGLEKCLNLMNSMKK